MPGYAGLQTNLYTWLIMAGMTGWWVVSVGFTPGWEREGWPSLLKSVYGFVWLSFGLDILLRFLMLTYNAVEWGNNTSRLVAQNVETVNTTLFYCGLFWLLVTVAFGLAVQRKGAGPLAPVREFTLDFAYGAAIPVAVLASVAFFLTEGHALPLVLITPVALLANLYMVPAAIVWWDHFRQAGPTWKISGVHVIVLMPAVVRGWMSPYRENLAPVLLIPLIAAMFAGRRPALRKMVPAGLICLLMLSSLVSSYRRIKWENVRPEEVAGEFSRGGFGGWLSGASDEPVRRFHAFDSMLLTVNLVPAMQPYSGRNVLLSPLFRGFVPRFIYSGKSAADAGTTFGTRIWAFDNPTAREQSGASIAPSMPGDLYEAGGLLYIALGGLIWGGLLGLVDGWKGHLPAFCAAAITVLVATQCAMSVERDFDNSLSTFIQTLLVFVLVAGVMALARRRKPEFARGLDSLSLDSLRFDPLNSDRTMERS
jgi:hypothetical protein